MQKSQFSLNLLAGHKLPSSRCSVLGMVGSVVICDIVMYHSDLSWPFITVTTACSVTILPGQSPCWHERSSSPRQTLHLDSLIWHTAAVAGACNGHGGRFQPGSSFPQMFLRCSSGSPSSTRAAGANKKAALGGCREWILLSV